MGDVQCDRKTFSDADDHSQTKICNVEERENNPKNIPIKNDALSRRNCAEKKKNTGNGRDTNSTRIRENLRSSKSRGLPVNTSNIYIKKRRYMYQTGANQTNNIMAKKREGGGALYRQFQSLLHHPPLLGVYVSNHVITCFSLSISSSHRSKSSATDIDLVVWCVSELLVSAPPSESGPTRE